MKTGISLKKIWSDVHLIELEIDSSDGKSLFSNKVYIDHQRIKDMVTDLEIFKKEIYGGIYNIRFGEFGPEYGGGAFNALLQFQDRGKIYVTIRAQSEFNKFGIKEVASEISLYFVSEPALLDNFITELKECMLGKSDSAKFEGIEESW